MHSIPEFHTFRREYKRDPLVWQRSSFGDFAPYILEHSMQMALVIVENVNGVWKVKYAGNNVYRKAAIIEYLPKIAHYRGIKFGPK